MPLEFKSDQELLKSVETVINKNYNAKIGQIVSGDSFIGSVDRLTIKRQFLRLWVEMEATAIAQTCHQFHVPL